ncbi:YafY family protein [Phytomonospora sp. NPDC050363]|uniref:helix-turn-helix transcriptional regulator n=1 Tax=Phytomonospora sp. NPDC050363 TaxID=3155642 RepID=UPI0033CAFA26
MTDTPGRLLTLLSLLQTPREWPGSELAERLGVSPRTIRRDVDRLRELGYPVQASMGAIGGYRLAAGKAMPPLLLDDEEAVAIAVGLRTAAGRAVAGIEEASVRALTKLEQVLPSRLRQRVGALGAATVALPELGGGGDPVDPENLTAIAAAVATGERLRFGYVAHDGAESRRHVDPHRLVAARHRWYLVAWDNERADWRIFRVDRITGPQRTGARAERRELPAADAAEYVRDKMYSLAPVYRAVVTVRAPAAAIAGRLGDSPEDVEALGPDSCRVRSHSDTLDWLALRLLQLGHEFEVHEPPELVEVLRGFAGRATRATGGPQVH